MKRTIYLPLILLVAVPAGIITHTLTYFMLRGALVGALDGAGRFLDFALTLVR